MAIFADVVVRLSVGLLVEDTIQQIMIAGGNVGGEAFVVEMWRGR